MKHKNLTIRDELTELEESAVSSILEHTAEDGKTYQTKKVS